MPYFFVFSRTKKFVPVAMRNRDRFGANPKRRSGFLKEYSPAISTIVLLAIPFSLLETRTQFSDYSRLAP